MIVWTTSKICVMGICAIGNCVRQGINVTDAAILNIQTISRFSCGKNPVKDGIIRPKN